MFVIQAPHPVAFNLFGISIYWYGIIMAVAILVGMLVGNKLFNIVNSKTLKQDVIIEYAPIFILGGILGARLYFCMLSPQYYLANPLEILDIREGGLSIHGALLGGILTLILVSKRTKVPLLNLLDAMVCTTILGQSIGRWGNYFNSEAYGLPVAGQNWGLFIPLQNRVSEYVDFNLFHPTFLYESGLDFLAFLILGTVFVKFGRKYKGITCFLYLILYSLIRFFVEQIRVDSALNLGTIPLAQVVSVVLFMVGIVGVSVIILRTNKNSNIS